VDFKESGSVPPTVCGQICRTAAVIQGTVPGVRVVK
jgi:hypothetical protein